MKRFLLLFLLPSTVLASNASNTFPNEVPQDDVLVLLGKGINAFLGIAGTIAVWFLIVGGFQYVTSAGSPDGVAKAKSTILYAIIGLITVIISYSVVTFILKQF